MGCSLCQHLESELERLERLNAEAVELLQANAATTNKDEYHRLRVAQSNARLDLEVGKIELERHKRNHQKAN